MLKSDILEKLSKKNSNISFEDIELLFDIFIKKIKPVLDKIKNLKVNFFRIENNFFGDSVTVAGLLTGKDIISQLKGKDIGSSVWATYRILNDEQTLTLDDMTLDDISKELQTEFKVSKNDSINDIIKSIKDET